MRCILAVIFSLLLAPPLHAAEVKNLKVGQSGDKGFAVFDLVGKVGEMEADVAVFITIGGERYGAERLTLTGDLGKKVKVGVGKRIIWDTLADIPAGFEGEVDWDVGVIDDRTSAPSPATSEDSLEKTTKEKGAIKTMSGLVFLSLKEGKGTSPGKRDVVKVNYRGTLIDGKEFDSSYKRGTPTEFPLDGVIKCWQEGVQMMKPGGKARLVCPPELAYGNRGAGTVIPPNATLIFEVELLEVK